MSNDPSQSSDAFLATDLFLAIDQGGQSTRIAVYSVSGRQICSYSAACATQHHPVENSPHLHIEQDPEGILAGIHSCLEKIQLQLGEDVKHIKAASFAGQGSSLLCWDNQTGAALTPVLSWQDVRGSSYLEHVQLSNAQTQALTGLRLSPHYGASKMRWCLEQSEQVKQAYKNHCLSIGPIVSYIFWHLLGKQLLVDPGHAQRTLLWNLAHNQWDDFLLHSFKIPRALLPQCKFHNSHFGDLRLGEHYIPFTASARDQGASLFARGLPEQNTCYINIGTGAFIQQVNENLIAPEGLLVSPLWLPENPNDKHYYAWEATVNGAASAIPYIQQQTDLLIIPQDIEQALVLSPRGDCYFLNAVGGLSAPYWRTDLEPQFSLGLSPQEKILAWIESVIFQIVVNVQLMNSHGGADKIIISGGFSKADAVCQKIADLTNANVHRSDNADATVQGAACMAAGLPQSWQPNAADEIFTPQANPALLTRFATWQRAMQQWLSA
jgi:glycerol kinase